MSVIPVTPDRIEVTTLLLQPSQSFSSSSMGMTGSIFFNSRPSRTIKSFVGRNSEGDSVDSSTDSGVFLETDGVTADSDLLFSASELVKAGETDVSDLMRDYLTQVSSSSISSRQFLQTYPVRFVSSGSVSAYTFEGGVPVDRSEWTNLQRRVIKDCLVPLYRNENHMSHYAYVNYHSVSFVSSSNFGTGSALIFPNFSNTDGTRDYTPPADFTIDFFVKPKAQTDSSSRYRAGTILHLSSTFCVSLVSGSTFGPDAKPDTFRILLQLSRSADIAPSLINLSTIPASFPNDLVFATPAVLNRDAWHRVTIRWGKNTRSYGSGSILVDQSVTQFNVPSSSISTSLNSEALIIGNYFNSNQRNGSFFNTNASSRFGIESDPLGTTSDPVGPFFSHQLNAEVHNISIFKRFVTNLELRNIASSYLTSSENGGPCFLLGPYFTSSIPSPVSTYKTPNRLASLSTDSPISYQMALGYNANFLNLQNFTLDFANRKQSRAFGMSEGTAVPFSFDSRIDPIESFLMLQTPNRARNFSILPCDNGRFVPNFSILDSDDTRFHKFKILTSSMLLSMEALAPTGSAPEGIFTNGLSFESFRYDGSDIEYLPLYQNVNYLTSGTPDNSSNKVIVFSIPSIYYMSRIVPGTFVLTDSNVSGSGGLSFTLKDDGRGNLYRSDTTTLAATWNKVGSIFYSHGIVAIISPHLPFFGKSSYEMSFRGEMRRTILNVSIPANPDNINLSHNSTFKSFPPTDSVTEQASEFRYITGINLHDENLNVIMRAKLAQAIQKREGDEIVFRLRYDF